MRAPRVCFASRRRPRPRLTRFRTPSSWSTIPARSSEPTRLPVVSWAWPGSSDVPVPWSPPLILRPLLVDVLAGRPDHLPTTLDHAHVFRDEGQERFFLPRVLAIRGDDGVPMGAAVVLTDVTRFRLMDQLKNDMVSTVSHELKTPLTGVQMAIHLLLEEVVGLLNPKQIELLLAARQDSDRLLAIVNDLLDLTRIEQGRVTLDLKPVAPAVLLEESVDRFASRAEDYGIALRFDVAAGLPSVRRRPGARGTRLRQPHRQRTGPHRPRWQRGPDRRG